MHDRQFASLWPMQLEPSVIEPLDEMMIDEHFSSRPNGDRTISSRRAGQCEENRQYVQTSNEKMESGADHGLAFEVN
jgi:hypothetical protein